MIRPGGFHVALAALLFLLCSSLLPVHARTVDYGRHHSVADSRAETDLSASSVLVVDRDSGSVLFEKNSREVRPIASITKLMVAVIVLDAGIDLNEPVFMNKGDELASLGKRRSRLRVNRPLKRDELLKLMLMSSENKAAHALARSYPGGYDVFMQVMNDKAQKLGMFDTRFRDPTGLSHQNVSTAWDLQTLLHEANRYPLIRDYSTQLKQNVDAGRRKLLYVNSNRLVREGGWDIELQKTGTTARAGKCVAMLARMAGRPVTFVLLNAQGKHGRVRDARRLRTWLEARQPTSTTAENRQEFR